MKWWTRSGLFCLLLTFSLPLSPSFAQQQSGASKTPRLTTEDVLSPRAPAPAEVEISSTPSKQSTPASKPSGLSTHTTGRWTRYSPDEANLSIELPGEPHAFEIPGLNAASSEFSSTRAFLYSDDSLNVVGVHLGLSRPMSADEIKVALSGMTYGLAGSSTHGLQFSFEPIGPSSLSVKLSSRQGGDKLLFEGVAKGKERDLWFVMAGSPGGFNRVQGQAKRVLSSIQFF